MLKKRLEETKSPQSFKSNDPILLHVIIDGCWRQKSYWINSEMRLWREWNGKDNNHNQSWNHRQKWYREKFSLVGNTIILKCSCLTLLTNHQDPIKHMGGRGKERLGSDLEYFNLCKIWQGHSCLKNIILLHVKSELLREWDSTKCRS